MSKVIPGIQGRPFRKVVSVENIGGWLKETLSCGHWDSHMPHKYTKAKKRRCYHPACRNGQRPTPTKHWLIRRGVSKTFCGIKVTPTNVRIKRTIIKEHVTCRSCISLMKLHDHLEEEYVDLRSLPKYD